MEFCGLESSRPPASCQQSSPSIGRAQTSRRATTSSLIADRRSILTLRALRFPDFSGQNRVNCLADDDVMGATEIVMDHCFRRNA